MGWWREMNSKCLRSIPTQFTYIVYLTHSYLSFGDPSPRPIQVSCAAFGSWAPFLLNPHQSPALISLTLSSDQPKGKDKKLRKHLWTAAHSCTNETQIGLTHLCELLLGWVGFPQMLVLWNIIGTANWNSNWICFQILCRNPRYNVSTANGPVCHSVWFNLIFN